MSNSLTSFFSSFLPTIQADAESEKPAAAEESSSKEATESGASAEEGEAEEEPAAEEEEEEEPEDVRLSFSTFSFRFLTCYPLPRPTQPSAPTANRPPNALPSPNILNTARKK